jgi:hypothetical protein
MNRRRDGVVGVVAPRQPFESQIPGGYSCMEIGRQIDWNAKMDEYCRDRMHAVRKKVRSI